MQSHAVVVLHEIVDDADGFRESLWRGGAQSVVLEGAVPALKFPVALRVVRACADMGHAAQPDEVLEFPSDKLRAVVADDTRARVGIFLASALQDALDVALRHALADFVMHDGAAGTVEDRAQIVEGSAQVQVRDVHVPVLVYTDGLLEARALFTGSFVPSIEQARRGQNAIDRSRTARDQIGVEHHEGQTPIAFQWVLLVEVQDGLFLLGKEPVIARDLGVVLVGFSVAQKPVVKLMARDAEPTCEPSQGKLGAIGQRPEEIDHRVARIVGNPVSV